MIYKGCMGTVMLSCESDVVRNCVAYSELEKYLITLSSKYGLGDVLFRERNPKNNNANDSFFIRAPKDWPYEKVSEIWDCVIEESHAFLQANDLEEEIGICGISVTQKY